MVKTKTSGRAPSQEDTVLKFLKPPPDELFAARVPEPALYSDALDARMGDNGKAQGRPEDEAKYSMLRSRLE